MFHEYCASDSQEHALEQCLLFDWTRLYYIIFPNQDTLYDVIVKRPGFFERRGTLFKSLLIVGWLKKYSLHIENESKDIWNKILLLLQILERGKYWTISWKGCQTLDFNEVDIISQNSFDLWFLCFTPPWQNQNKNGLVFKKKYLFYYYYSKHLLLVAFLSIPQFLLL